MNFYEFCDQPSGTVYSYYEPEVFDEIHIKLKTIKDVDEVAIDFFYQDLSPCFELDNEGNEKRVFEDCSGRWGMFDFEQQFAVWEDSEVDLLISLLENRKELN